MLRKGTLEQGNGLQPLRLRAAHPAETHADSGIERTEPDAVNVFSALGQDSIEVVDTFQGLDLDDDSRLVVDTFMEGLGWVEGNIGEAGHQTCGRC